MISINTELLAPAGSFEALKSAIACGADAVYLGGKEFGARNLAINFSDTEIEEATQYAHLRGVKVFITVNTLIHDSELEKISDYLFFLFSIGVDALIIQDAGVLRMAKELYSSVSESPSLHASTQMAVHNREGALHTCSLGCKRIVLARELTLPEIQDIADSIQPIQGEVEIFAHGALCYAYSGQCLLSAIIGGRSGNRGMCAQPCRKPYILITGGSDPFGRLINRDKITIDGQYLLSTQDLCVYPIISQIISPSISALKIEGRMRSASYVATVTGIYRKAIDAAQNSNFHPIKQDITDLTVAFSRGFTTGYVSGENFYSVMGNRNSVRQGILVGTVIKADRNTITLKSSGDIIPSCGDGMVCISKNGEIGFVLRKDATIKGTLMEIDTSILCSNGDKIFLTNSARHTKAINAVLQNPDQGLSGLILLDIVVEINHNGIITITGTAKTKNGTVISHSFNSEHILTPARTHPLTSLQIEKALNKTGGTLFSFASLTITCPHKLFAPMSIVNDIRREIISQFSNKIYSIYKPSLEEVEIVTKRKHLYHYRIPGKSMFSKNQTPLKIIVLVSDIASLDAAYSSDAAQIFIEWYPAPKRLEESKSILKSICDYISPIPDAGERIGIKIPKIIRREELDLIYDVLPSIIAAGVVNILVDGAGIAEYISLHYPGVVCSGFAGLNITNHIALLTYANYKFLTLSCELSGAQILQTMKYAIFKGFQNPVAIIGQGLLEAMITEDQLIDFTTKEKAESCLLGIKDEKGLIFPVISDPSGRTHIFNAVETSLIDKIPEIKHSGISIIILDARWRGPKYTQSIIQIWNKACVLSDKEWSREIIEELKQDIKAISYGGLTSGTWKRGLSDQ